MVHFRGLVL
jgi:hypothetical protein